MRFRIAAVLLVLGAAPAAEAAIAAVDLAGYRLAATYNMSQDDTGAFAREASAITWDWDTNTLFIVGDEGRAIVQISRTGQFINSMSLTGFLDTEGLTYRGNGQFVVTEERRQQAFLLNYAGGGSVNKSTLGMAQLGPQLGDGDAGNVGVEGISYDPVAHNFVFVKEKSPQQVNQAALAFDGSTPAVTSVFSNPEAKLGLTDLSDVQVLSTVASLQGTADADNLLIFSQESRRLVETNRNGDVLSFFNLPGSSTAEGVTIDGEGNIYIIDEGVRMYVLAPPAPAPVPLPAAVWGLASGLGFLGAAFRRRRLA
ncbi:MAG: SdiA-regulated domain-containing protein [Gammaproteobacteria bacterium]